jgi:hypothetical protein
MILRLDNGEQEYIGAHLITYGSIFNEGNTYTVYLTFNDNNKLRYTNMTLAQAESFLKDISEGKSSVTL